VNVDADGDAADEPSTAGKKKIKLVKVWRSLPLRGTSHTYTAALGRWK
jgi:hypothetical protein